MILRVAWVGAWITVLLSTGAAGHDDLGEIKRLIHSGHWLQARQAIDQQLAAPDLSYPERQALLFQVDRLGRIRLDFDKTRDQIFQAAQALAPGLSADLFAQWEQAGSVEYWDIDGQRWYFRRAAGNLFRVNRQARDYRATRCPQSLPQRTHRLENLRAIIRHYDQTGERLSQAKTFRVNYTLTVKPDTVPAGEIIRVWLPFPQSGRRQSRVRLIASEPPRHWVNPDGPIACVYLEKLSEGRQATVFRECFEYTATGFYQPLELASTHSMAAGGDALAPDIMERLPHIVFRDELRALSQQIIGAETNPVVRARRIFQWISDNIPWAGAREYSTIDSLTDYVLAHRWGDCGMQTMLFMTLCRWNGIPARWESGWMTGPDKNMHDWCAIYLEPYGWIPVDVSLGLIDHPDDRVGWAYLGGIDSYRLVVNTDYAQSLYPVKMHFRSELIDFQRGEAEWRGGNLYFNQWDWDFDVEEIAVPEDPSIKSP